MVVHHLPASRSPSTCGGGKRWVVTKRDQFIYSYYSVFPEKCKCKAFLAEKRPAPEEIRCGSVEIYFAEAVSALENFSSTGTRRTQMTAAVKPPLYRQKPPCILGTEVTSRKCMIA